MNTRTTKCDQELPVWQYIISMNAVRVPRDKHIMIYESQYDIML